MTTRISDFNPVTLQINEEDLREAAEQFRRNINNIATTWSAYGESRRGESRIIVHDTLPQQEVTFEVPPSSESELISTHRMMIREIESEPIQIESTNRPRMFVSPRETFRPTELMSTREIVRPIEPSVVDDSDIIEKKITLHCTQSRRDNATFKYKKGKIEICAEEGCKAKISINLLKEKEKIKKLIKDLKTKEESDGVIRNVEDEYHKIQKGNSYFKFEFRYSDESIIAVQNENGRKCYIIASNQDVYKLRKFLEKVIKIGGIKMSSLLKINCIEEENDNVEVLDCNDGQNVAIKTDSDGEVGMIFMSPEDAVKMAKEILKQYEK